MDLQTKVQVQQYLKLLYSKRWFIIAFVAIITISTLVFLSFERKEYKSSATILIENNSNSNADLFGMTSGFQSQLENHIEHIKAYKVSKRVFEYLKQHSNEYPVIFEIFNVEFEDRFPTDEAKIKWLRSRLEVTLLNRKADIIVLTFKAYQPSEALYIANIYQKIYVDENLEFVETELKTLKNYLINKLQTKEEELKQSEEQLRNFQNQKGVRSLTQQTQQQVTYEADLRTSKEKMQLELESALEEKKVLDEQIKNLQKEIENKKDIGFNSSYLNNIAERIAQKRDLLSRLKIQIKNRNATEDTYKSLVEERESEIRELEKEYQEKLKITSQDPVQKDPFLQNQNLREKYMNVDIQIKTLQKQIKTYDEFLQKSNIENQDLPDVQLQLARLTRNQEIAEKIYLFLHDRKEETEIRISSKKNNVKILDEGILELNAVYPRESLILVGSFVGSFIMIVLIILVMEYFDNTVKSEEEIDQFNITRIGLIPKISMKDSEIKLDENKEQYEGSHKLIEARLVSHIDPQSMIAEAYRTLRTNIRFKLKENPKKNVFLISSCGPQEGKSTSISNLAITLCQQGLKVLLMDADLRRPVLHSVFGVRKEPGLSNLIMSDIEFQEATQTTLIDNLHLISCGIVPPNPSELLSFERMNEIIAIAREEYDVILIDTPPIIAVTDAAILSASVDHSILVIRSHKTDRDMIKEAKNRLISHRNNLIGCILNDFDLERHYGYKYQYYNYYHKK